MTWIKICGNTNLEDALTAVEAGADALGFVFYGNSPRCVTPQIVKEIVARLPQEIEKVGVFVDEPSDKMAAIVQAADLTAVQLHFGTVPDRLPLPKLNVPSHKIYLALPASYFIDSQKNTNVFPVAAAAIDAIFLDSGTAQRPGGTGKVFDWEKAVPVAQKIMEESKLVIAGGLTPVNVMEAMVILKPWGVDVVSGVEAAPGKKDPEKVRAFIAAVRQADPTR